MEGAAGLPRQLKLEPGITREMRMCGTTQVRQTEEEERDGGKKIHRENNRVAFIPESAALTTMKKKNVRTHLLLNL